ncbi:hypothetical protein R3P38DRAFT_3206969 [Favolaschia claudopus]|uniref:Uncharacterized protein n=1 Tax=Favolaschia claudopus TaxID=2862362 RepID=A0AAW0AK71_9AGAR
MESQPSSGTLYPYYNAPLLEVATDTRVSAAEAYHDDVLLLAAAPTYDGCDEILDPMALGSRGWSKSHNSGFQETKFGVMRMHAQGRTDVKSPENWNGMVADRTL